MYLPKYSDTIEIEYVGQSFSDSHNLNINEVTFPLLGHLQKHTFPQIIIHFTGTTEYLFSLAK